SVSAVINGKTTPVADAVGMSCPDVIYPNYNDYGYVKIALDKVSLRNSRVFLSKTQDNFLKEIYLKSLWRMVRDGDLSIIAFAELMTNQLRREEDDLVVKFLSTTIPAIMNYLPKATDPERAFFE